MTPAQLAFVSGADQKWIQNLRRLLERAPSHDEHEARWLGIVHMLHTELECSLQEAARIADLALATSLDQRWLRIPIGHAEMAELTLDLWRDHSIHLARLAYVLSAPDVERRGRPSTKKPSRRRALTRAMEYGVDVTRLRAGLGRTVSERLLRLDDNAAFLASGRASLARRRSRT